jgi:hypothetical protein
MFPEKEEILFSDYVRWKLQVLKKDYQELQKS